MMFGIVHLQISCNFDNNTCIQRPSTLTFNITTTNIEWHCVRQFIFSYFLMETCIKFHSPPSHTDSLYQ